LERAEQGAGPLGPALPMPDIAGEYSERAGGGEDDIEWIDDNEEAEPDATDDIDPTR
jgi:hypothetical protein